jgi:predicted N-acetyltransferase YhbS
MEIIIREERIKDYELSEIVVKKAFRNVEQSDHKEHYLVSRLRKTNSFIPELSIVAEFKGEIVGHIMLTKLYIKNDANQYISLALAPVSVLPEYQDRGIGTNLINKSINIAKKLGYKSVIVLGHENYYPRFGFKPASKWGIKAPFDVPDESFMALELNDGSLDGVTGTVVYAKEFFE